MPAINDINNFTNLNVELVEKRESGPKSELQYIRFIITRKNSLKSDKRYGINKLAFYIGSRMFYFSKNNIKNLLAFSKDIEKAMTNNDDILIYDSRSISDWKEESDKAYELEIELLKVIDNNKIFMDQHSLIYDDKRMCLVKQSFIKNENSETNEIEAKINLIVTSDYRVENPMSSLLYLHEVVGKESGTSVSIVDYLPFSIADSTGWIEIKDIKDYIYYETTIKKYILDKKVTYFKFEVDLFEEIFHTNIMRGNFKEINDEFRDMLKKLTQ